jgi:hypothetical protein
MEANMPSSLVKKVWIDLCLHFGMKGKEAIRTLTKDSFIPEVDENGHKINFVKSSEEIILFIVTFGRFLSSIFISSSKTLLELNAICLRIEMRHDSGSEFIYRINCFDLSIMFSYQFIARVGDGFLHNCACFLLAS